MIEALCSNRNSLKKLTVAISLITVVIFILGLHTTLHASSPGYAYGLKSVNGIRGNKQWHWLDNALQGYNNYSHSVVGICSDADCLDSKKIKTGYAYGTLIGNNDNNAKQYVRFKNNSTVYFGSWLPEQQWYKFQVLYSYSAARWEAWRDDVPRWYYTGDAGFTSGTHALVGGESGSPAWFNVYGKDLQYRIGNNAWTFYNYSSTLTYGGCITPAYTYGFHAVAC